MLEFKIETRGKLGRVNVRKDFWDCYWGQGKNWPIAHRHVPSYLVSKVANEAVAILMYPKNPVGIELFSHEICVATHHAREWHF